MPPGTHRVQVAHNGHTSQHKTTTSSQDVGIWTAKTRSDLQLPPSIHLYGALTAALILLAAFGGAWACKRYTGRRLSLAIALVMNAVAVMSALFVAGDGPSLLVSAVLGGVLVVLAAIDQRSGRLPDAFTLPLLLGGLSYAAIHTPDELPGRLIGAAAGYSALALVAWGYRSTRGRDGLGMGDAKLFAALGAWVGWRLLPEVLLIASVLGLTWVLAVRRGAPYAPQSALAFGPFVAAGGWIAWLWRLHDQAGGWAVFIRTAPL